MRTQNLPVRILPPKCKQTPCLKIIKPYLACHPAFWYHFGMDTQSDEKKEGKGTAKFVCPHCGELSREDVVFLCNVCKQEDVVLKNGIYMCPACFKPGENFQCMLCDSKEVRMVGKDK